MKLENADLSSLFSNTLIPDIFFSEYLSEASGDFIKVYLYMLFLSKYDKDIKINDLSKKLVLPVKTIQDAVKYWEEKCLITKKNTGYIINSIQEIELHKLYKPKTALSAEQLQKSAENQKRAKAIEFINNKYVWTIPYSLIQGIWTADGNNELESILGGHFFDNPKPSSLIKTFLNMNKNKKSIVLDFFAGSGTTAQAVMELNEEDCGNRRFILCTNNENNIATDICRERIYRVINGKGSENEIIDWKYSDDKKSLDNNSMKYLRVKPIHKINGNYEDINDMEPIYVDEFDKDYISIKDFK